MIQVRKTVIFSLVITILIIGACGCMNLNNSQINTNEQENSQTEIIVQDNSGNDNAEIDIVSTLSIDDRMMDYINSRYDDNFTYYERKSGIHSETQRNILVKSEKYPDVYINVLYAKDDGGEIFNDNYLYFVYKDQTVSFLHGVLANVFNHDFKLFYGSEPPVGVNTLPANATFDEYISSDASWLRFTAVLAPGYEIGEENIISEKLRDAFAAHSMIIVNATLHFCDEADTYDALTNETLESFQFSYNGPILRILEAGTDDENFAWR